MDGRSRYFKIKKMMSSFVGQELHLSVINRMIMLNVGSSDRTIREVSKFMIDLGIIKEVDHLVFRVEELDDSDLIADVEIEEEEIIKKE